MVQIPKSEYSKLKELRELERLDVGLIKKVIKALKNFKQGRFREWT